YVWSNGQTSSNATGLSASTYTVTITDANGCTLTITATVTNAASETVSICGNTAVSCNGGSNGTLSSCVVGGTTPYTYAWTPAGGTNALASNLTAGTYTITVHDANGCISTASATITQPPLLVASTAAPVNVLCNGGSIGSDLASATGGTGAYSYSWAPGGQTNANATGLSAGTYTVTLTDANGCTATAKTTITQPPVLSIAAAGFPVTCNGGSDGSSTAIPAGGTPAYIYAWAPAGGTGAIASNLTAGTYTITVTDAHGCMHDTTVTVTQPNPIVVTFSADSLAGCAPLCVNFKDLTVDAGGTITKWNWSFGDGDKDSVKNPRHCYSNPGSYNVTLTVVDNHGCTSTLVINNMITVYSFPVPAFTFGPQPATITDPTISFTDRSTDAYGIATWLWNFNDPLNDNPSNRQNPTHSYGDTGTFCATLTVTNIHGCTDSVTECLVISSEYTLYIPNSFSPNADGLNDIFKPKGDFVTDYKMFIFDRWGMLLFNSSDINKGWDGTVNGGSRICEEDTYVYMIEITDNLGKKHSYIGRVTLVR
ncbi:MAG TPA: PKD domain-containing protein, partial [Bacteroidia bacterium]|nr:PKD domain-containing protein [Bacteroidia bacterium]